MHEIEQNKKWRNFFFEIWKHLLEGLSDGWRSNVSRENNGAGNALGSNKASWMETKKKNIFKKKVLAPEKLTCSHKY